MMLQFLLAAVLMVNLAGSQGIDPDTIPKATREQWCAAQTSSCPLICLSIPGGPGTPDSNTCNPETLAYSCVCGSGQSPNSSQYSQTIPYFICQQQNINCVHNCNGVTACQSACRTQHPCGAQNPKRINITTTRSATTASSTTPPTGVVYTGFGSVATEGPKEGASPVTTSVDIGRVYGLFIVMAGIFAGFSVLL